MSASGAADRPARVVDQDVDAAEVFFDLGHEFVDRVEVGQVARFGPGVTPAVSLRKGVEQFLAASDRHHGGAAAGELLGGGLADARRRAGQQDALAAQVYLLAVGPVKQQLRAQRRSHACQNNLIGQPPHRALAHKSAV